MKQKVYEINNKKYVYNREMLRNIHNDYLKKCGLKTTVVKNKLAEVCYVEYESVKKWFSGANGYSDEEKVMAIAGFYSVEVDDAA